jgi:uncharacterized delta-60 repeat protein
MKSNLLKKIFFAGAIITILSNAKAQDGSLDFSFDSDGKVITAIGTFDDVARAVKVQNDGKIVVAGFSYSASDYDFMVIRYNTDGSLDSNFGIGGVVTTDFANSQDKAYCMAIQNDGKIVVAGYAYSVNSDKIALARYNSNGTLDSTFNTNGKVITAIGSVGDYAYGIALQNDGKIVVTGGTTAINNLDLLTLRYNTYGSLDTSFDGDGIVVQNLSNNQNDLGNDVVIQTDGKILVAGYANAGINSDFALLRFNTDGSLDNSFDSDGILTHGIVGTFNEYANALALQNDGKIVVTGNTNNSFYDFVVTRYNIDGSIDNSFDTDGAAVIDFGTGTDFGNSVDIAVQSDDKIISIGYQNNGTNLKFSLARFNTDGSLDVSFDTDGMVETSFAALSSESAYAVAIQADHKILVAGSSYETQGKVGIARYNNSIISSFKEDALSIKEVFISPNPANYQTTLYLKLSLKNASINIYNSLGQVIASEENLHGNRITLQLSHLQEGIYFVQLMQNDTRFTPQKLVIKK